MVKKGTPQVKQFNKGLQQVIIGIVSGILFNIILSAFKKSGILPSNVVIWFTVVGLVGSIVTMFSFKTAGVIFTLGWILGAWLLKSILEPFDFLVYFWAPIFILGIRTLFYVKKSTFGK